VSFTANLTPDPETGLGKWTVETFIAAIRTGKHEGQGRPILPPMPWPMYKNATDDDLRAIFAFLRSIPPIKNRVPRPIETSGATASDGSASAVARPSAGSCSARARSRSRTRESPRSRDRRARPSA
jgi:hypothetical protein